MAELLTRVLYKKPKGKDHLEDMEGNGRTLEM
jgi:hypothetical protein